MKKGSALTCRLRAVTLNCKHLLLFAIVFGCGFLLSIGYGTEFRAFFNENLEVINSAHDHTDKHFSIKTEGCIISALEPFSKDVKRFVKYPTEMKPCSFSNGTLLDSNDTHIWIIKSNLYIYNISEYESVNCCYNSFNRPNMITNINSKYVDDRVSYKKCQSFNDSIKATDEFVQVTCGYFDEDIYEDYFVFTPKKTVSSPSKDNINYWPKNSVDYNVIIMGIDAVSRMNFHRTMPKTLEYLRQKGAIELLGYNKVGDNTFPNIMPLLLGVSENELRRTCLPTSRSAFDNCPFVWQWFKDRGYYTALGEDSAKLGTFNYLKVGFTGTPTDYYLYTFMHESEKHIGNNKDFNSYLCMGDRYYYRVLLNYIQRLTTTLDSEKLFGFFWEVTMSHDYLNYPMAMDEHYAEFFDNIELSGYMNKTVLILMSDHGIRWGKIRSTKQGRLEERLPFVFIYFPPSFRINYESAYNNIKSNANRLTTPFDLHEMLIDLGEMKVDDRTISTRMKTSYAKNRAISLFLPVPGNRTCEAAGIAEHWCTCQKGRKLRTDRKDTSQASAHLLKHINSMIRDLTQCAPLTLAEVIEATEMNVSGLEDVEKSWREILLVVRVSPSNAIFEATLRKDEEWTVTGSVSRLNLYGDQSRCVDNYQLKLYCYCK